jgi:hypothetical protein
VPGTRRDLFNVLPKHATRYDTSMLNLFTAEA